MLKATKIVKDERKSWYGYCENSQISVNIQLLWEESENEDKFIKDFSRTYTHELLHDLIDELFWDVRYYTEEKYIRKMLGEHWNKEIRKLYR